MSIDQIGWDEQFALFREEKDRFDPLPTQELNAEPPAWWLDDPVTPVRRFFVRNTGAMPRPDLLKADGWTLTIDGCVSNARTWTIEELKQLEQVSVTAVLECAGNGRAFFPCNRFTASLDSLGLGLDRAISRLGWADEYRFVRKVRHFWRKPPWRAGTVMWTDGAVGCAEWTGVRLRDVLKASGLSEGAVYTAHHSDDKNSDPRTSPHKPLDATISRGLPIAKACDPDTLIAWAMNGEPLRPLHGGPLRVIAPGFPGSAWHKWIRRIEVRSQEHTGRLMDEYRIGGQVIEEMPVNSVITAPARGLHTAAGKPLRVTGYAWSGHAHITQVVVSADGGSSWRPAELGPKPSSRFTWRRFETEFSALRAGPVKLVACASDENGNAQPLASRSAADNAIGYCNNVARRVTVYAR